MCVPPDANKEERVHIFRNLLFAIDKEIFSARGENHITISGDLNRLRLPEMIALANTRGFQHIATSTRKSAELDAIFVSKGLNIVNQTTTAHNYSDHDYMLVQLDFNISSEWVEYAITVPISMAEKRTRLQNKDNRKLLEKYELKAGPFQTIAQLGHTTKRLWVRFGYRPPQSFMPKGVFDPLFETRAAVMLNMKRQQITSLWKQNKTKKAWVHIRRFTGAFTASPTVEGLKDGNDVAHLDDAKKVKFTIEHLKKTFQ